MNKQGFSSVTLIIIMVFSIILSVSVGVIFANHNAKIQEQKMEDEITNLKLNQVGIEDKIDSGIKENRRIYGLVGSVAGIEVNNLEDLDKAIDLINVNYANLLYYQVLANNSANAINKTRQVEIHGGHSHIIPPINPPIY